MRREHGVQHLVPWCAKGPRRSFGIQNLCDDATGTVATPNADVRTTATTTEPSPHGHRQRTQKGANSRSLLLLRTTWTSQTAMSTALRYPTHDNGGMRRMVAGAGSGARSGGDRTEGGVGTGCGRRRGGFSEEQRVKGAPS